MIMLILICHIFLAVFSLVLATSVIVATKKQKLDTVQSQAKTMWYGTIGTVSSGLFLAVLAKATIGRTCSTLLTFLVLVGIAHYYQRGARQKAGASHLNEV